MYLPVNLGFNHWVACEIHFRWREITVYDSLPFAHGDANMYIHFSPVASDRILQISHQHSRASHAFQLCLTYAGHTIVANRFKGLWCLHMHVHTVFGIRVSLQFWPR